MSQDNVLGNGSVDADSASVLVIILQCETKSSDKNIANLKSAFSDPYFVVQVCSVDPPSDIPDSKFITKEQYIENFFMYKVLSYAQEGPYVTKGSDTVEAQRWWVNIPVIIVKDSSISNIDDSIGMKKRIKLALEKAK